MNIKHRPLYDIDIVEAHYTKSDGVPVKYVCTTALDDGTRAMDVYYRATPHPQFGNRYFGLFSALEEVRITNADAVESLTFGMIEHDGNLYYSQHRWDYFTIGDKMIDGGRAYVRGSGPFVYVKVKDGEFVNE